MWKKAWPIKYNNGQSSPTHGQAESVAMAATQSKAMSHAQIASQSYVFYTTKLSTDHSMITPHYQSHTKTQTEDITMDGQEEYSQSHHQLEVMMLIHLKLVISYVKIIGERMLNLLILKMDTISVIWTLNLEKHGDSGIGNWQAVVDGHSGDISTLIIMAEHGLGLTHNHTQIVVPFDLHFDFTPQIWSAYLSFF